MEIEKLATGYIARTTETTIKFRNIVTEKNAVHASIHAFQTIPVYRTLLVTHLNLSAPRSVAEVGNALEKLDHNTRWSESFPALVAEILNDFLTPPEPTVLNPEVYRETGWLIQNFLPAECPTILFAPGGSGKSFFSLLLCLALENGINVLGRETQKAKTLYLDYEVDESEMSRRLALLVRGLSTEYTIMEFPEYLRMHTPLVEVIDSLLDLCARKKYQLMVIDSAVCAVGGDLNDSSVVTKFFSAVRRLNVMGVSVVIVSHVSKAEKKGNGERTPIGSVHFENFPRVAWELRSEYDEELQAFNMGLFCRKSNLGKLSHLGVRFFFDDRAILVSITDPSKLEGTQEEKTFTQAILELLSEQEMAPREIAQELEAKVTTVYAILDRLRQRGEVTKLGKKWRRVKNRPEAVKEINF